MIARHALVSVLFWLPLCAIAQTTQPGGSLAVRHEQNTGRIARHGIFEITFVHENDYRNAYEQAQVAVVFTTPTGKEVKVGGFLYGSTQPARIVKQEPGPGQPRVRYVVGKPNVWKARLAPWQTGTWKYRYRFTGPDGQAGGEGVFACVAGRRPAKGFIRINPANPFRWVYDDGTPYFPIGLQDGWGDPGLGTVLAAVAMEGPFRLDRNTPLPQGPQFVRSPSNNPQNADVYFRAYSQAGFNLFRWSQRNNAFALDRDLQEILLTEAGMADDLLAHVRKYEMSVMYGLLGNQRILEGPPLPDNPATVDRVKAFIKYSVDRWGAYVDIWQLLNEKLAHEDWLDMLIPYIRQIDPYDHPITTSWQRPDRKDIDINAPHWYHRVDTITDSDEVVAARAAEYKRFGKNVIVGEHGNNITCCKDPKRTIPAEYEHFENEDIPRMREIGRLPAGAGGTWDPDSALRMRLRNWTALFQEIAFVYWNTSYARDGHVMNMWLGPQERQYIRAMQDFAGRLDRDVKIAPVSVSEPSAVRAYCLRSDRRAGLYLHHFADYTAPMKDLKVTVNVPAEAKGYWYDPATAVILSQFEPRAGEQWLAVPPFRIDLALLLTPDGPPDIDRDGRPNDQDDDDDNDGTGNAADAFPLDPSESADADGDLIGDNMDADDNGDGKADDLNNNGKPDNEEMDLDGDGVVRANCVPWDAFPLDPKETRDTDGDGVGDNADPDDDDDGWTDVNEIRAGTDPLRPESFPADPGWPEHRLMRPNG